MIVVRQDRRLIVRSSVDVVDEGVLELASDAGKVKTVGESELQPNPGLDGVEETGSDPVFARRGSAVVAV